MATQTIDEVEMGTIETRIPARLDRLPLSRFHWIVIAGLGTAWIPRRPRGECGGFDLESPLGTGRRRGAYGR